MLKGNTHFFLSLDQDDQTVSINGSNHLILGQTWFKSEVFQSYNLFSNQFKGEAIYKSIIKLQIGKPVTSGTAPGARSRFKSAKP